MYETYLHRQLEQLEKQKISYRKGVNCMRHVFTDCVTKNSYDSDYDSYQTMADALVNHPERFPDISPEEKDMIIKSAEDLGWHRSNW